MRYYDIKLTSPSGKELVPRSLNGMRITSDLSNGLTNPGALNVELDIPVAPFSAPAGLAYIRVWGLSLEELGAAFDLNGAKIEVRGGMKKGLPLATLDYQAGQAGLLVKGAVFQALGNWVGTSQTIDLIVMADTGTPNDPKNYVLEWTAGTSLAAALKTTFDRALPGLSQTISISDRLVQTYDEVHYTSTLEGLAVLVKDRSKDIIRDIAYPGVDIHRSGDRIFAIDQTSPPEAKKLAVYDLIGQPTWIQPNVIQVKTVLRADLYLQDVITLPTTLVTTTAQALTALNPNAKTTFNGNFVIQEIHHYGNYRQPDGASWNTTLNAYPQSPG